MPVEEGRQFETRLNALILELDALGRNISSQQSELAERLTKLAEENPEQNGSDQS